MKMISKMAAAGLVGGLLVAPQTVFAAGFANTAQSATSTGLGGVGTANPDEPNSSYYNPAAMTARDQFNVYVGPTLIMPRVTYDGPGTDVDAETVPAVLPPPNLHIAVPFGNMAAGVGVVFPYGLTIEWPDNWAGRGEIRRQRLTTVDINPNFAYEIEAIDLSLAVGAQFVLASVELENTTILRHDREVQAHLGGTGFGAGATASAFYRPIEELTLGLTYRSASKIDFDGVAHFEGEEGTPFESTFVDQDITTSITLPHALVAGVSYDIDRVFVEFDVGFTTWSTYDEVNLEFTRPCEPGDTGCEPGVDTNPPTSTITSNWYDSPTFRMGLQYDLTENWPLRAGVAYDLTPIPEETVGPSLPGNNRSVFSLGTGYTWNSIRADVAYMAVITSRQIANGKQDGVYDTFAHLVGLNLGYGFE